MQDRPLPLSSQSKVTSRSGLPQLGGQTSHSMFLLYFLHHTCHPAMFFTFLLSVSPPPAPPAPTSPLGVKHKLLENRGLVHSCVPQVYTAWGVALDRFMRGPYLYFQDRRGEGWKELRGAELSQAVALQPLGSDRLSRGSHTPGPGPGRRSARAGKGRPSCFLSQPTGSAPVA